jgi:hypothetical protein
MYYSKLTIGSDNSILQIEHSTLCKVLGESFLNAPAIFGVH